jgi:hypothetical protein
MGLTIGREGRAASTRHRRLTKRSCAMKNHEVKTQGLVPLDASEWTAIDGGECRGVWLGTYDGHYGLCLGYWVD